MTNNYSDFLFLIPARGGSKGIPEKNIKPLAGKPLIHYTIEAARKLVEDQNICVSTDSDRIIDVVKNIGLGVPFKRPDNLATDLSGSREVILHALEFYESKGIRFKAVVLLQPTSPLRSALQIQQAIGLCNDEVDMVVSVKKTAVNPLYNLFIEDAGYLKKFFTADYIRRQDADSLYQYNGAIYVMRVDSVLSNDLSTISRVVKYEMDAFSSVDIDSINDWEWCEYLLEKNIIKEND